jgi:hypothetical protein
MPRAIGAASGLRGLLHSDAALAELSISCSASFPPCELLRRFSVHSAGPAPVHLPPGLDQKCWSAYFEGHTDHQESAASLRGRHPRIL